ncbi:exodeoxyribonuclease VII small subunit [Algoriphagus aestuariicola]|jgi:exodeoxyribonuclease VII small subunit|uniref:Exodeoxyribonuclease VII small subunit n=1 Tax=Algoriphagus aestuariicola TaxID=1852016 RepID=A0ABS3BVQ9_9BACT|nr:exodeoxyribonuclease VII small subunit [Algoriphagus aestuariicola]MBN7803321.1 exodeoxyribonuclease VII small subunit [Algoriphagus aestuariicola]
MKEQSYAESMARLESILNQLEEGNKSVDELSDLVKEAAELVKHCRAKLRATESDIQQAFQDN